MSLGADVAASAVDSVVMATIASSWRLIIRSASALGRRSVIVVGADKFILPIALVQHCTATKSSSPPPPVAAAAPVGVVVVVYVVVVVVVA